jgi:hypothetical protein
MDATRGLLEARCALRRIETPEIEHMAVPVTTPAGNVALPQAESPELLRDIEQLAEPCRFGGLRAALADILKHPGQALVGAARLDAEPALLQMQLGARESVGSERAGHRAGGVERGDAIALANGETFAKCRVAREQASVGGRQGEQVA